MRLPQSRASFTALSGHPQRPAPEDDEEEEDDDDYMQGIPDGLSPDPLWGCLLMLNAIWQKLCADNKVILTGYIAKHCVDV